MWVLLKAAPCLWQPEQLSMSVSSVCVCVWVTCSALLLCLNAHMTRKAHPLSWDREPQVGYSGQEVSLAPKSVRGSIPLTSLAMFLLF